MSVFAPALIRADRPITSALTSAITAALGGFNPRSLFADGSVGVLYDNNDLSTFFSDSAGTTAAVVNGPVGLQLDKSQGLVLGAELVTNGTLNGDITGWTATGNATISYQSGVIRTQRTDATGYPGAEQTIALVSGRTYQITLNYVNPFGLTIFTGFNGIDTNWGTASSGTLSFVMVATGLTRKIQFGLRLSSGAVGQYIDFDNISVRELPGNHRYQTTATSRPTLRGTPNGLDGDGTDDSMLVASGGGGTTGFLFQSAIKLDAINKRQTLWSDAGTNTGYKVEINASNQLVFSAGNGTAYTSVTTANTVAAGTTYSVECYDDGTNLVAILNQGTPATAARPTVSAGTTGFTMQKDNGAASGFMDGLLCSVIYLRNTAKNSATRAQSMRWIRQKAGL